MSIEIQGQILRRFFGEDLVPNPFVPIVLSDGKTVLLFAPHPEGIRKQVKHLGEALGAAGYPVPFYSDGQTTWVLDMSTRVFSGAVLDSLGTTNPANLLIQVRV